jgi:hypothetical protein
MKSTHIDLEAPGSASKHVQRRSNGPEPTTPGVDSITDYDGSHITYLGWRSRLLEDGGGLQRHSAWSLGGGGLDLQRGSSHSSGHGLSNHTVFE